MRKEQDVHGKGVVGSDGEGCLKNSFKVLLIPGISTHSAYDGVA